MLEIQETLAVPSRTTSSAHQQTRRVVFTPTPNPADASAHTAPRANGTPSRAVHSGMTDGPEYWLIFD
jgi:hypothetical protein